MMFIHSFIWFEGNTADHWFSSQSDNVILLLLRSCSGQIVGGQRLKLRFASSALHVITLKIKYIADYTADTSEIVSSNAILQAKSLIVLNCAAEMPQQQESPTNWACWNYTWEFKSEPGYIISSNTMTSDKVQSALQWKGHKETLSLRWMSGCSTHNRKGRRGGSVESAFGKENWMTCR